MSKNVKVNGVNYSGVSQVQLPTTAGGTALFKDVDEITEGGGGFDIDTAETLLCTVETEDLIGNILAAHPITPKYKKEMLLLTVRGANAPTKETNTLRAVHFFVDNDIVWAYELRCYQKLVAPDSIESFIGRADGGENGMTMGMVSSAYTKIENGALTFSATFKRYVAAGNTVSYYEVPLDIVTPTIDTTLRAAE